MPSYYEKQILNQDFDSCPDCNRPNTYFDWCQNCNSKRLQQDFNKWTSGNEFIDKFIQDAQLKARNHWEVIEWIPYDHFIDIQYIAQGGFSTVYKAIWLDSWIDKWDREKQQWERYSSALEDKDYKIGKQGNVESPLNEYEKNGQRVVLKSLNNSSNIKEDSLNEWRNYLKFIYSTMENNSEFILLYGITQDPATSNHMIVMDHARLGSLRSNLMIKKYNPNDKYRNLYFIAESLLTLHKCNLVHGDFHSGNLLLSSNLAAYISDFGLSQPADNPIKSKEIYGVLPYIAPEVLCGKPYTKAADIYSFGIIMWEMTSGILAFNNVPHDINLTLSICQGFRPKIIEGTEFEYAELMKKCWNPDPDKRPSAEELYQYFDKWENEFPYNSERIPVPENEPIIQNHPLSYYASRKIDYSAELNEILNQKELSSTIIINDEEDDYIMLSENLENCKIPSSKIDSVQELESEEKNLISHQNYK